VFATLSGSVSIRTAVPSRVSRSSSRTRKGNRITRSRAIPPASTNSSGCRPAPIRCSSKFRASPR
jgi:hypothetical protein